MHRGIRAAENVSQKILGKVRRTSLPAGAQRRLTCADARHGLFGGNRPAQMRYPMGPPTIWNTENQTDSVYFIFLISFFIIL